VNFTDPNHGTCNGDSGGPAFMTLGGVEVIVGITSFGDSNCTQGSDTRVDVFGTFVDTYVQMFDPVATPPPPPPDMTPAPSPGVDGGTGTGPGTTATVDHSTPGSGDNTVMGGCSAAGRPDVAPTAILIVAAALFAIRRRRAGPLREAQGGLPGPLREAQGGLR
jgi:uncharacterized protein (TIGR03382 family)